MSFYVTLPSDITFAHPDNKANNYKVTLPKQLYLPEDDWEVALATISFPDSQTHIPINVQGRFPLALQFSLNNTLQNVWSRATVLNKAKVPIKDGVTYWKKLITTLQHDLQDHIPFNVDWKKSGVPEFHWNNDELMIDNSKVIGNNGHLLETHVKIDLKVALAFHLVEKIKTTGKYKLGECLKFQHFRSPTPDVSVPWENDVWQVKSLRDPYPIEKDGKLTQEINQYLQLSSVVNWYITDINQSFQMKFGQSKRTLFVFSDIAQTQIVGYSNSDMLKEVVYDNEFKGRTQFEPKKMQFLPVRKNVFSVIEVSIAETDGALDDFAGGSTILTVQFRRRNFPE